MWTLFDTGIRVNELCHIRLVDVHIDEGYILITHGNWQKERPVGISKNIVIGSSGIHQCSSIAER